MCFRTALEAISQARLLNRRTRIKTLKALVWAGNLWRLYIEAHLHFQRHRQVPMVSADIPKQTLADFLKWVRFWYFVDGTDTQLLHCNENQLGLAAIKLCRGQTGSECGLQGSSCCLLAHLKLVLFCENVCICCLREQVLPRGVPCRKTALMGAGQEGCFCWWWLETEEAVNWPDDSVCGKVTEPYSVPLAGSCCSASHPILVWINPVQQK